MSTHLVNDLTRVASNSTEQSTVTVHDDETKLGVALQQVCECFSVEFVVAQVEGSVDGLEGCTYSTSLTL